MSLPSARLLRMGVMTLMKASSRKTPSDPRAKDTPLRIRNRPEASERTKRVASRRAAELLKRQTRGREIMSRLTLSPAGERAMREKDKKGRDRVKRVVGVEVGRIGGIGERGRRQTRNQVSRQATARRTKTSALTRSSSSLPKCKSQRRLARRTEDQGAT